jgi:hypothetical protein
MNVRPEVAAAQRQLRGLRRDTLGTIGEVAKAGYKAIDTRAPGPGETTHFLTGGNPLFRPTMLSRAAILPDGPIELANYRDTEIGAVRLRRTRGEMITGRGLVIPLPASSKAVDIAYSRDGAERSVAVVTTGEVYIDGSTDLTTPRAVTSADLISQGYATPGDLNTDYRRSHTSAIIGTEFVIASLADTHGVVMLNEKRALRELTQAWAKVGENVPLDPRIAELYPRNRIH